MTTDDEVGRATPRHRKDNSGGTVVLETHGPTTTLTRGGERHPRVCAGREIDAEPITRPVGWAVVIDLVKARS